MAHSQSALPAAVEYDPFSPSTVLLLVQGQRNRAMLQSVLKSKVDILVGREHLEDESLGLIIADQPHVQSHVEALASRQAAADDVFLPILMLVSPQVHGEPDTTSEAWHLVDEVLRVPVKRHQIELRIKMLLQARRYSQVSAQRHRQLQQEMESLEQQKEEFQKLFTACRDPIFVVDDARSIQKANAAARELLASDEDLTGESFDRYVTDTDDLKVLTSRLEDESGAEDVELPMVRADGRTFTGNISASRPYKNTHGETVTQFIVRDVSQAKQHEQELIDARERAEEMSRMKSAFLANMSHEVRTPLASIIGYAEILSSQIPDKLQTFAEAIYSSGQRLLTTLDTVITLAEIQSGSMEAQIEEVDIDELASQLKQTFCHQVEDAKLSFHVETPDPPLTGRSDHEALFRILSHLVHNAIKFTQEGNITVSIQESPGGDGCVMTVSDTGVGMNKDLIPKLLEAFQQESTGTSRQFEGSGLGLTLVDELTTLLDGSLTVESEKDAGTTVTVRVPWDSTESDPTGGSLHTANKWGLKALPAQQRVLLVDDDPSMCKLLIEMLPDSYESDVARTPQEAISLGQSRAYDLIFLDINLKDSINGVEVHERLRETETAGDALIVAVTAYAQSRDGEKFHAAGFDGYVPKPFEKDTLFENLIQIMD